jgi:hypothetical protein
MGMPKFKEISTASFLAKNLAGHLAPNGFLSLIYPQD